MPKSALFSIGGQVLDGTDLQDALGHDLPFPTKSDLVGGLREGVEASHCDAFTDQV